MKIPSEPVFPGIVYTYEEDSGKKCSHCGSSFYRKYDIRLPILDLLFCTKKCVNPNCINYYDQNN